MELVSFDCLQEVTFPTMVLSWQHRIIIIFFKYIVVNYIYIFDNCQLSVIALPLAMWAGLVRKHVELGVQRKDSSSVQI